MEPSALKQRIQSLDDSTATRVLKTFASAHSPGGSVIELTPTIAQELQKAVDVTPAPKASVSDGELARAALLFLASDSVYEQGIAALVESDHPQRMVGVFETIAVASAVLMVLQIHIKIERDKQGHISFHIEKKPTDSNLLKTLVQKLLSVV